MNEFKNKEEAEQYYKRNYRSFFDVGQGYYQEEADDNCLIDSEECSVFMTVEISSEKQDVRAKLYRIEKLTSLKIVNKLQLKFNEYLNNLYKVENPSNELILSWIIDVQDLSDDVYVKVPKKDILEYFNKNGYYSNVNTGSNFKEDDPDNHARYIIGQALENLETVGAIHRVIKQFASDWIERFGENK